MTKVTIQASQQTNRTERHGRFWHRTHKVAKSTLRVLRDAGEDIAVMQGYLNETDTDSWREHHG